MLVLVALTLFFGKSLHAQIAMPYPVTNMLANCDITIGHEITIGCKFCEGGQVHIPYGTTVMIGTNFQCLFSPH